MQRHNADRGLSGLSAEHLAHLRGAHPRPGIQIISAAWAGTPRWLKVASMLALAAGAIIAAVARD